MLDDSRRQFLSKALAGAGAMAGLGLLAQALGSPQAEAAEATEEIPSIRLRAPVRLRTVDNGISLEITSRELAKHLVNEGIVDQEHSQGIATIRYDLTLS
jgi:hypothetical protein